MENDKIKPLTMPEYIWELACGQLDDGEYRFPEGVLIVRNGFVSWKDGNDAD